jgi:hypothetical protein
MCQQVSARLMKAGLTPEIVLATLPEARKRVYERIYGTARTGAKRVSRHRGQ